jgi:hypothetical protein
VPWLFHSKPSASRDELQAWRGLRGLRVLADALAAKNCRPKLQVRALAAAPSSASLATRHKLRRLSDGFYVKGCGQKKACATFVVSRTPASEMAQGDCQPSSLAFKNIGRLDLLSCPHSTNHSTVDSNIALIQTSANQLELIAGKNESSEKGLRTLVGRLVGTT